MRPVLSTRMAERWKSRGRGARWTVAVAALVAVLGSGQTAPEQQPAESLRQRVAAFWEARLKGDEVTAYQYEAYSHTGEMTATQYIQARSPALKYMGLHHRHHSGTGKRSPGHGQGAISDVRSGHG